MPRVHVFERRRLHTIRENSAGPQGLPPSISTHGGPGLLAGSDHSRPRGLHRVADEYFSRHRQRGSTTVHPAPRPAGFLRVLDDKTIDFVDFSGNRQYITQGNLAENPKAHLFLIDNTRRRRIKIWGDARVVEGDPELIAKLMPDGYEAHPERVILFTISAWDANCSQHIPQRFEVADVTIALAERGKRIEILEAEIKRLRAVTSEVSPSS